MNKLSNTFYYEARIAELRQKGFELAAELDSLNLRLRDQEEEDRAANGPELKKRYQSVEEQLENIQLKIKELYDKK